MPGQGLQTGLSLLIIAILEQSSDILGGWRGSHCHWFQLRLDGRSHDDMVDEHSTLIAGLVSFLPSVLKGGMLM